MGEIRGVTGDCARLDAEVQTGRRVSLVFGCQVSHQRHPAIRVIAALVQEPLDVPALAEAAAHSALAPLPLIADSPLVLEVVGRNVWKVVDVTYRDLLCWIHLRPLRPYAH